MYKIGLFLTLSLFFGSCSTKDWHIDVNASIPQAYTIHLDANESLTSSWWEGFHDPHLERLVALAFEKNPDVFVAYEGIKQSKIALASAKAIYFPEATLSADTKLQESKKGATSLSSKSTSLGLGVGYELDIWNKIGANIEASKHRVALSEYEMESLKISLASSVAQSYLEVLLAQKIVQIALQKEANAKQMLDLYEQKLRFGVVTQLDVVSKKSLYLRAKQDLIDAKNGLELTKNGLAFVCGIHRYDFNATLGTIESLHMPKVDAGLTSELLLRRPDIAHAKKVIEYYDATKEVAEASRYPSFSLSATGGIASSALLALGSPTSSLALGAGVNYNLFDGGRLKNQVLIEDSRIKAALHSYQKTLLQAFKEVEDALVSLTNIKERLKEAQNLLDNTKEIVDLTQSRVQNGVSEPQQLLSANESYLEAQREFFVLQRSYAITIVALMKALGGGWKEKRAL